MNIIKVGIIGSGFGLYGLLPAFNSTPKCKVTCICGRKTKRLTDYCKGINLAKIYSDWQIMLRREKLDTIAIAVPPNAQYKIAKEAINKGLHVFAEKPLAATLKQAKELLQLAKKKKIKHMVDFEFLEIKEWKKVKNLIDKKTFGELKQICVNWDFLSFDIKNRRSSWKTDIAEGGGALSFYFSHSLHYLEHFAGKISDLNSQLTYPPENLNSGEVGVDVLIKFKNGATGNAHLCCNARGLSRHQLLFICKKATIVLENTGSFTSNFTIKLYTDAKVVQLFVPAEKSVIKGEDERVRIIKKLTRRFVNSIMQDRAVSPHLLRASESKSLSKELERIENDHK